MSDDRGGPDPLMGNSSHDRNGEMHSFMKKYLGEEKISRKNLLCGLLIHHAL